MKRKQSFRDSYAEKIRAGTVKVPALSRSRLNPVSPRRMRENDRYRALKADWLRRYPSCQLCPLWGNLAQPATELHHWRGRVSSLLCDTRFFRSACHSCHTRVHEHPAEARAAGALSPANEWNSPPGK